MFQNCDFCFYTISEWNILELYKNRMWCFRTI